MSDYMWELITFEGTRFEIPPDAVDMVKRKMGNREPINTRNETIPSNQIKTFRKTDKPHSPQLLIEDVARAFDEPMLTEDGSIQTKWVKKAVTQERWNRHYSHHPYKKLREENGMLLIAFKLPVHLINQSLTPYCTDDELNILQQR